jgi:hypothetical protein
MYITVAVYSMGIEGFGYAQIAYGFIYLLVLISGTYTLNVSSTNVNNICYSIIDFLPKFVYKDLDRISDNDDKKGNNNHDNDNYGNSDNKNDDSNSGHSNSNHKSSIVRKRKNNRNKNDSDCKDDKNDNDHDYENEKKLNIKMSERMIMYNLFNMNTISIAIQATFSSFLKHLLTEADKIALSLCSSPYDQGIYIYIYIYMYVYTGRYLYVKIYVYI